MATKNNKMGEEERGRELNLSFPRCLFPCFSHYWVSLPHFSRPLLFSEAVFAVMKEAEGEFMCCVFEVCLCISLHLCFFDLLLLGGWQCDTEHVWRPPVSGQGQGGCCYVRRLGSNLWPSADWDRWTERRRYKKGKKDKKDKDDRENLAKKKS